MQQNKNQQLDAKFRKFIKVLIMAQIRNFGFMPAFSLFTTNPKIGTTSSIHFLTINPFLLLSVNSFIRCRFFEKVA